MQRVSNSTALQLIRIHNPSVEEWLCSAPQTVSFKLQEQKSHFLLFSKCNSWSNCVCIENSIPGGGLGEWSKLGIAMWWLYHCYLQWNLMKGKMKNSRAITFSAFTRGSALIPGVCCLHLWLPFTYSLLNRIPVPSSWSPDMACNWKMLVSCASKSSCGFCALFSPLM